jgi:hypothetical protein
VLSAKSVRGKLAVVKRTINCTPVCDVKVGAHEPALHATVGSENNFCRRGHFYSFAINVNRVFVRK